MNEEKKSVPELDRYRNWCAYMERRACGSHFSFSPSHSPHSAIHPFLFTTLYLLKNNREIWTKREEEERASARIQHTVRDKNSSRRSHWLLWGINEWMNGRKNGNDIESEFNRIYTLDTDAHSWMPNISLFYSRFFFYSELNRSLRAVELETAPSLSYSEAIHILVIIFYRLAAAHTDIGARDVRQNDHFRKYVSHFHYYLLLSVFWDLPTASILHFRHAFNLFSIHQNILPKMLGK